MMPGIARYNKKNVQLCKPNIGIKLLNKNLYCWIGNMNITCTTLKHDKNQKGMT